LINRCSPAAQTATATCSDARAPLFCIDRCTATNDKRQLLDMETLRCLSDGITTTTAT